MKRTVNWGMAGVICFAIIFWAGVGVGIAHAEVPATAGEPTGEAATLCGTEVEPSATQATIVYLTQSAGSVSATTFQLKYQAEPGKGFKEVAFYEYTPKSVGELRAAASMIVSAKGKITATCTGTSEKLSARWSVFKGGEGKEGKEGPEGKPGSEGKEGKEGKEGAAGPSGKSEVTNFGPTAETTLSEIVERIEVLIWCVIGTLLAGVIFVAVRQMTRMRRA